MQRSTLQSKHRAFTLIELITVITIIVILLGVMLPTISNLLRGNNQKQALNIISALVASARATALNNKVPAGIVFYEDPANKNATAMVLVMQDQTVTNPPVANSITLKAVSSRIDFVPVGIKVAALSNAQSFALDSSVTAGARIVLFDASGQVNLRGTISGGANSVWNLDKDSNGNNAPASGVSSPAVVVFDSGQLNGYLQANGLSGAAAALAANQWLQRYADTVVINSYTGNAIR